MSDPGKSKKTGSAAGSPHSSRPVAHNTPVPSNPPLSPAKPPAPAPPPPAAPATGNIQGPEITPSGNVIGSLQVVENTPRGEPHGGAVDAPRIPQWEYINVVGNAGDEELLQSHGLQGWELVSVVSDPGSVRRVRYYFKRRRNG